eukprot:5911581-Ditylum_brightwellii.AAC.1
MKALKDINWRGARELLNNAFFGHNGKKGVSNNTRRSCNICILFDSMEEDKSRVKQQFSNELRNIDSRNQVWLSILQISANSTRAGRIFYFASNFDISSILQQVAEAIKDEDGVALEIAVKIKAAFKTNNNRVKWYKANNISNEDDKEKLNMRKVPTIY